MRDISRHFAGSVPVNAIRGFDFFEYATNQGSGIISWFSVARPELRCHCRFVDKHCRARRRGMVKSHQPIEEMFGWQHQNDEVTHGAELVGGQGPGSEKQGALAQV